jgi:type II secretory ATPase GspE/PulE/Tfp pilus assembly ATPase PilB-like protein
MESKEIVSVKKGSQVKKIISSIQELPSNWKLLTNTTSEKDKFFLKDEIKRSLAILQLTYVEQGVPNDYIQFIGTKDILLSSDIVLLRKSLVEQGTNVYLSSVEKEDIKIIQEIYKTSKDEGQSDDKDYSLETGVPKEVNDLFIKAVRQGVSDIHLEVRKNFARIRARTNGRITNFYATSYAESTGYEWGRVIYQVMSAVSNATFNAKTQQDALVVGIFGDEERKVKLRVRVATNPTEPSGFDMTMRLLIIQDSKKPLTLEELGYNKKLTFGIKQSIAQPVGLTIISGTTGSGKSTTLQNILLSKINDRNGEIKVITVEDPPEYFIPGATQVPVIRDEKGNAEIGFSKAIKAAMRSDPDVIMVGEIRDEQSATLTVQAVQSGHQVFSTIHAQSALGILNRIENLGVTRDILGSPEFIAGLIYQKLLPILCPICSIKLVEDNVPNAYSLEKIIVDNKILIESDLIKYQEKKPKDINIVRYLQDRRVFNSAHAEYIFEEYRTKNSAEEKELFLKRLNEYYGDISELDIRFQGNGCSHPKCKGGVIGRTVVAELVRPDLHMLGLITEKKDSELLTYWKKTMGGKYAAEDACDKIKMGIVSPINVEHELGHIGAKIV